MSKYVVFKCTKCGKTGVHEVRSVQSKHNYYLSCKYCDKKNNYLRAVVYKIFNVPQDATLLMNQINLGKIEALPLDEVQKLVEIGASFMRREGEKITPVKKLKKVSVGQLLSECLEELQTFSMDELEECMGEREVLFEDFEKEFEKLRKRGDIIEVSPNTFRFIV